MESSFASQPQTRQLLRNADLSTWSLYGTRCLAELQCRACGINGIEAATGATGPKPAAIPRVLIDVGPRLAW